MLNLRGEHIYLRALELKDLDFLYELENDTSTWEISGTVTPYSRKSLQLYLENSLRDIYDVKQLRLCICNNKNTAIGLIDLFDFDPKNHKAGIGIIIKEESRNKGVGGEVLDLMINYAFSTLNLHQLYANILENNVLSVVLFEKKGFTRIGIKEDWIFSEGEFKNEILYQIINK